MSKAALLEKLTDKNYRDAFISDEIDVGLPTQLRTMREVRGWRQDEVATKLDTKQPRMSLMEKVGYGNFSLNTLKKIASIFDVGLIVSFVPFSEMIDFTEAISNKRLAIPAFMDEYDKLQRRYSRSITLPTDDSEQAAFDFTAGTGAVYFEAIDNIAAANRAAITQASGDTSESEAQIIASVPLILVAAAGTSEVSYAGRQ